MNWERTVFVWFVVSVVAHLLSGLGLWFWLARHRVKMVFGLTGIPGYLERRYRDWAQGAGRSSRLIINLRIISTINVVVISVIAALMIIKLQANGR
jgi:hypothetical protein